MPFSLKKRSCLCGQEHGYGADLPRTNGHIAKIEDYMIHFLMFKARLFEPQKTAAE